MTSASFNPIQIDRAAIQQSQSLSLKQGQVFHGTIKKLYPDQMAEIQIGNQKLFAKLETPLKAGDSHFFQVTSINPEAQLKVVTGPMQPSQTMAQQMTQLLDSMNLPKTAELQKILAHFIKNQLPISKDQLIQAENWLNNLPEGTLKNEAIQVIHRMIELKLPFTDEIFKGLLYGAKTTGIAEAIENFANVLSKENNNVSQQIKLNLLQQLQAISKPFAVETGGILLSKAVQTLLSSETSANNLQALNFLKEAEILPKNSTIPNWLSQSFQQITSKLLPNTEIQNSSAGQLVQTIAAANAADVQNMIAQVKEWLTNQQLLTSEQKSQLQQLITRFEALPKNAQTIELLAKQLHEQLIKSFSENAISRLFTQDENGDSAKNQLLSLMKYDATNNSQAIFSNILKVANDSADPFIQNAVTQADAQVLASIDSRAMEQALKTIFKSLGMSYEASLNSKGGDISEIAQSLKPQLISLLQDAQTSQPLKESADIILSRLNGMQLFSGESGPQHQLIMQVPLQFLGKHADATIQWNGRMKENGKIDANYARVLFYLNMEALQETVVDMQVQNRIITIHLYNNHPHLEILAEPLKQSLKTGLLEKDYQFSGLFIKKFENTKSQIINENVIQKNDSKFQNGVDIRI
ncbi:hypothetical protein U5N28_00060 [Lysinibacillus telephonicus]|uniref:hypothetical protein n=1 Tax=Lysinibacillus telephonicus TaxID=1714840 RepID=UPI003978BCDE